MAAGRDRDWAAIREEWERSGASDAEVAKNWGFASKTSIERRRKAEGWSRDAEVVAGRILALAAEGTSVAGVAASDTSATLAEPSNGGRVAGEEPLDVAGFGPSLSAEALGYGPSPAREATRRRTQAEIEERQREEQGYKLDLVGMRVQATREQLRQVALTRRLVEVYIDLMLKLASGDPFERAEAQSRLHGLNPDKETQANMLKSVGGLAVASAQIERAILGLDGKGAPVPGEAQAAQADVAPAILPLLSESSLQDLRRVARELEMLRIAGPGPATIDGKAEG